MKLPEDLAKHQGTLNIKRNCDLIPFSDPTLSREVQRIKVLSFPKLLSILTI